MLFSYSKRKIVELFANSRDPDQMPHFAMSDLGLHCLPITLLGVFRLQRVKDKKEFRRKNIFQFIREATICLQQLFPYPNFHVYPFTVKTKIQFGILLLRK